MRKAVKVVLFDKKWRDTWVKTISRVQWPDWNWWQCTLLVLNTKPVHQHISAIDYIIDVFQVVLLSVGQCRTLLHAICHLPIKSFRTDIVTMATHCWQWLITSRPNLEYSVSFLMCLLIFVCLFVCVCTLPMPNICCHWRPFDFLLYPCISLCY